MTIETVRQICLGFPGVTEDVKWGNDLVFSVAGKMFAALDVEPPHSLAFKCSPESFAELVEREGIIPAPYLARALWAQEQELGHSLYRRELAGLLREAYDIVVAKLPASRRPGASSAKAKRVVRPRKSIRKGRRRPVRR